MTDLFDLDPEPIDHLPLRGRPGAVALIDKAGTIDFAALELQVAGLAAWLRDRGFVHGDRVASWLAKTRLACLLPLAAPRAGLVHVPINPLLKHRQVAHILSDSGARLLIAGQGRLGTLAGPDVPAECAKVDEKDAERGAMGHMGMGGPGPSDADPDALAAILYTSGSTGRPKGVMLSHANLWLGAESVANYLALRPEDRTLCVLPLSFDYGQNQLFSSWHAGASVVPFDYLVARDVVRAVERFGASVLAGVPPLWVQLAEVEWPGDVSKRLRVLTNSGGKMAVPLVRQLRTLFPAADVHSMYGLTEAFRSTSLDPAKIDAKPDSIGQAIPFAEIMVVDEAGKEAAIGEPGELVHAGPLVAQGYWRDPARTAERFRPAPDYSRYGGIAVWSGDTVVRDEDGDLRFVSRDDAMIKTAGNRVSPGEVEEEAIASGLAAEACAFGVPDDRLGEAIVLVVRGSEEQGDALRKHLQRELPNFMQPREIVWSEALPKNPNGKIDRAALVAEWAA